MQRHIDALAAEVAAAPNVSDGVRTLLRGLRAQLDAAPSGSQLVTDLAASLKTSEDALVSAVVSAGASPNVVIEPEQAPAS